MTNILTEANRDSVILVDFQPAYSSGDFGYTDALENTIFYLNKKQPSQIFVFFNGSEVGIEDTPEDVYYHFVEHGLDEDKHFNLDFHEKTYAFLRNWMDLDIDSALIIRTVRYMVMNDINDTREIDDDVFEQMLAQESNYTKDRLEDRENMMYLPDMVNIASLKALSGSLMGGGGRSECLAEIQLMMNAFNIKYKLVDNWIYG